MVLLNIKFKIAGEIAAVPIKILIGIRCTTAMKMKVTFWVPEDTLVKNMMNLQTIEGKK